MTTTKRIVSGVALAAVLLPAGVAGQDWRTVTMSQRLERVDDLQVSVEYGAGQFSVRSVDDDLLYRMRLEYDEEKFEPVADFSNDRLRLGIETIGRDINLKGRQTGSLDLELPRGVPMDLELTFGAVQADIDLGGLDLTDLELSTGASESFIEISEPNRERIGTATFAVGAAEFTAAGLGNLNAERIEVDAGVGSITLGLDGRWASDGRVSIDMGLGHLELRIPEGVGLRLRKDSFLTAIDSEGLIKRGDVYESPDFDDAERRVEVELDAAFGAISVVWTR